ncbi:MAG: hypothetical protein II999_06000 [Bacteroidaceae bacterium]|jgi:MFS family permease|nr:hypothetical protein [Bacteroidaceae bacterium]
MKTFKLLPHGWQTAGWTIAGMGAGMMLWGFFLDTHKESFLVCEQWVIGVILWTIAFLIMAFAQEEYEDERIRSIRMNTLGITAIIYAALVILNPLANILLSHIFSPLAYAEISTIKGIFLKPVLIYVLLFKFFLWKENRSLKYEEEV